MTRTCWLRLRNAASAFASLQGSDERRLFVAACLLAPWVRVLMRLPLGRLNRVLLRLGHPSGRPLEITPERLAQIVELAQECEYPLVRGGCLARGVTLFWLLRRRGVDVSLAFGIGGPGDQYQGHCWLVRDGEPYLEKQAFGDRFVEQFRIPAAAYQC